MSRLTSRTPTSLSRRLLILSALWIAALLSVGGFALDHVIGNFLRGNFDARLDGTLTSMVAAAEIGPEGS